MKYVTLVILILYSTFQNFEKNNLIGKYYSVNNKFEKWSDMELLENDRFEYSFGLIGCQAKITGTYKVNKNRIAFKNDKEYINNSNVSEFEAVYPDLSLCEWKIKSNSIKPISKIDNGCFEEKSLHIKGK